MPAKAPLRIVVIAAEASGDMLGASLLRGIEAQYGGTVHACGVAGPLLRAAGCTAWHETESFSVMGIGAVFRALPRLLRLRIQLIARIIALAPDVCIGIDAPDFTLAIERAVKRHGIRTVHCVSPSVWAWRNNRVRTVANACDMLLTILPFEASYYAQTDLPVRFVGHPLTHTVRPLDRTAAATQLGLDTKKTIIALFPGSRQNELTHHIPPLTELATRMPDTTFCAVAANDRLLPFVQNGFAQNSNVIVTNNRAAVLSIADAAVCKSGTISLECALYDMPHIVFYRLAPLSYSIMRLLIRTRFIALPNIITAQQVVPELIQQSATPAALQHELTRVLRNSDTQRAGFADMRRALTGDFARDAGRAVCELLHNSRVCP